MKKQLQAFRQTSCNDIYDKVYDNKQINNSIMKLKSLLLAVALTIGVGTQAQTAGKGGNILVAYFSWGGNTEHVAKFIAGKTGGTLFRITPSTPYPTEYTSCTEVAKAEKEQNARPAIKDKVAGWDKYDIVFIGCPVWWWTAPMIINTFTESYSFKGKTVVPFCTYAATYRDETLAKIAELTSDAKHLKGFGAVNRSTDGIEQWLKEIKVIK